MFIPWNLAALLSIIVQFPYESGKWQPDKQKRKRKKRSRKGKKELETKKGLKKTDKRETLQIWRGPAQKKEMTKKGNIIFIELLALRWDGEKKPVFFFTKKKIPAQKAMCVFGNASLVIYELTIFLTFNSSRARLGFFTDRFILCTDRPRKSGLSGQAAAYWYSYVLLGTLLGAWLIVFFLFSLFTR